MDELQTQTESCFPAAESALGAAVEYIVGSGVAGDVAEFGCLHGRTAAILARSMEAAAQKYATSDLRHGIAERRLWLLDSFEGFPEASDPIDAASPHIAAKVWRPGAPAGGSVDLVMQRCCSYLLPRQIKVIPGWFSVTLQQIPDGTKFALVHIDCDFYSSTREVLDRLFAGDMLSDGATVLFDDWYCNRGSPRFGQQRAWAEKWEERNDLMSAGRLSFSDWGHYGIAGRRFIIHRL